MGSGVVVLGGVVVVALVGAGFGPELVCAGPRVAVARGSDRRAGSVELGGSDSVPGATGAFEMGGSNGTYPPRGSPVTTSQ